MMLQCNYERRKGCLVRIHNRKLKKEGMQEHARLVVAMVAGEVVG